MLKQFKAFLYVGFFALTAACCLSSFSFASAPLPIVNDDLNVKKLSFYFQNISIRALLQIIAKNAGLNFIISDTVKGNMTLNLQNVTWGQALDIILKSHALASRRMGNAIFISTIEEITDNETKVLQSEESLANLSPLTSRLIHLKFTLAVDMAKMLKGQSSQLLSSRGEVAADSRTNTLIIKDTSKVVNELARSLIRLDVPARQVVIEARIVSIDTNYEEQLGIKFGLSNTRSLSGTLAGANQLAQGTSVNNVTPLDDRLNFNVPAARLFDGATPGSIGLALAHLGRFLLDLELSALEGEHHAQTISRPRVVTSNQQTAHIQTGEEIPYQEATSSGATAVVFKQAVLSLAITPQITPDNRVILKIKATQDTRGLPVQISGTGVTAVSIPSINTQEVESNVLLKNNETIVLGGVYSTDKENTVDRIPFFGSLPVIGNLFTHKFIHDEKHELLIFITPKIVMSQPIVAKTKFKYKYKFKNKFKDQINEET